ncbi:MAG: proline dehydrogenase family protein, partial [Candidatus Binatia bacterium]
MTEPDLEVELRDIAGDLQRRAAGRRPAIFQPRDWLRRLIEQSLDDEQVRTALFRFVDVLPSLRGARDVSAHLEEYFERVDHALGGLTLLAHTLRAGWLVAPLVRHNVVALARRFIVDEEPAKLLAALETLREEPAAFTLDVVGEATVSEHEALAMLARYQRLLGEISARAGEWSEIPSIDRGPRGAIPRVSISVKLSSLAARFDPLDPETEPVVADRLRHLFREARRLGASITVDMEQHEFKDATFSIFRSVLDDDEFRESPAAGIAVQAYLRETEHDLRSLIDWARSRGRRIGVRLVKGAYWDSEIAWAEQKGWPVPVFTEKPATDFAYERLSRLLLENADVIDAAFGSHNLRSLAHALAFARRRALAPGDYEIQMLYGMAEPLRRALIERGERVRVYVPTGELIPGMAYLIRRLLENTSNVSFLRESYAEGQDLERLLRPPVPSAPAAPAAVREFRNEPLENFAYEQSRERLGAALDSAHATLGRFHPL